MTNEQKAKLRAAQLAYIANSPRWAEHREKLQHTQFARRFTLCAAEIADIEAMRAKGRTWSYIAEEMCVTEEVLTREWRLLGRSTAKVARAWLTDDEIALAAALRERGREFRYIAAEIGVCERVLRREFGAAGHSTARVASDRRAVPGRTHWRSFEPVAVATVPV